MNSCAVILNTAGSPDGSAANHSAGYGGGVYSTGSLTMTNSTLSSNWAVGEADSAPGHGDVLAAGGAIDSYGALTMTNCTISGNMASTGPSANGNNYFVVGGGVELFSNGASIRNTLIASNTTPSYGAETILGPDIYGTASSQGHNLIGNTSGSSGWVASDKTDANAVPLNLGSLQSAGGPTLTMPLLFGSVAINAGDDSVTGPPLNLVTDQRGSGFPRKLGTHVDIGAFEFKGNFIVTTTDDHDNGACDSDCTLREAINAANSVGGDSSITFAPGVTGTIQLTGALPNLSTNMDLQGPGANLLTVRRNTGGNYRIFTVDNGTTNGPLVSIGYLTIRDGLNQTNNLFGQTNMGGGIYNSAILVVYGCSFINNHVVGSNNSGAASGGKGEGGAIYNSGTLSLDSSVFSQSNEAIGGNGGNGNFGHGGVPSGSGGAGQGGAIFNDAGGSLSIDNSTFNQNVVIGGNGGSGGPNGGNGGDGNGGAIFNLGTINIRCTTIAGNSGSSGTPGTGTSNGVLGIASGGVAAAGGASILGNTIVAGNLGSNGGGNDVDGSFISNGYNLIGTATHSTGFGATGDQLGVNPLLSSLQQNGVMLLMPGSPALDRGKSFGLTNDQRGYPRPVDTLFANATGGDGADIGAVEMNLFGGSDSDGDGMSDDFEFFFGLNKNDPTDANVDLDGDGLTNLQEFQAGTNPRDPASTLRVIAVARNGNDFVVTFATAVTSKSYRLERKDALTDSLWGSITGVADFTAISVGSAQITDTGGAAVTKHFYHVRVLP